MRTQRGSLSDDIHAYMQSSRLAFYFDDNTTCAILQAQQQTSFRIALNTSLSSHLLAELGSSLGLDPVEVDPV